MEQPGLAVQTFLQLARYEPQVLSLAELLLPKAAHHEWIERPASPSPCEAPRHPAQLQILHRRSAQVQPLQTRNVDSS